MLNSNQSPCGVAYLIKSQYGNAISKQCINVVLRFIQTILDVAYAITSQCENIISKQGIRKM